jgi:DNA polymerase III delta subunit
MGRRSEAIDRAKLIHDIKSLRDEGIAPAKIAKMLCKDYPLIMRLLSLIEDNDR